MKTHTNSISRGKRGIPNKAQRGAALITTLLLVLLLTGLSLIMVLSVNSDMLINGYYGNSRGSFYAADSGVNIARQVIKNSLTSSIVVPFTGTSGPLPSTAVSNAATAVTGTYSNYSSVASSGAWPEKFKITKVVVSAPTCIV